MSQITMTNTDPGEGSTLPSDNCMAVYGGKTILDMFYPVGSFYKTANISFDPNETWGGVWEEDTDYTLVAYAYTRGSSATSIQRAKNVSSVTKIGTGIYRVNFTSPMADTDYVALANSECSNAGYEIVGVYEKHTTYFQVDFTNHGGTMVDQDEINIVVYGKLATPEYKTWKREA